MSKKTESIKACSFCGKSGDAARRLIAGPGVYICDECVNVCKKILDEEDDVLTNEFLDEVPNPKEIKSYLDEYVVGQDQAKKSALGSRVQSLQTDHPEASDRGRGGNREVQRPPARSHRNRKTLLARTLAKKLKVPFAIRRRHNPYRAGICRRGR